jgi:radical SAM superfamily enzyme YgiQ (UPF0313 family)
MKNILLVNPPCRVANMFPLGLGYIAGVLRQSGHHVSVMDLNAQGRPFAVIEKELDKLECDIIGIGGLTTTYGFAKRFSALARKLKPDVRIMAGNMVSTAHPGLLLENSDVDICVIDEGEETVKELMYRIKDFPDIEDVKGIAFKKNNHIITTGPRERIKSLDRLPFPAWDLFPSEIYINSSTAFEYGRRSMNISTVRGCPFRCIYCSRSFGRVAYRRTAASIISEIKELKRRYKVKFIAFSDDLFILNRQWVVTLCDALVKERLNIGWVSSARVNLVDLDLLKKMKKAGCEVLSYGFESGSQKILDNMKKDVMVEQAEAAIAMTRKAGIAVNGSFMIGMIGETEETVNQTVDFIKKTGLGLHRFFYTTAYPKTPLYEMAKKMNKITANEDAYVSSLGEMYKTLLINFTDMSDQELRNLKEKAEKKIKENFPLRVRMLFLVRESGRIYANFGKHIREEGVYRAIKWFLEKAKNKLTCLGRPGPKFT